MKRWSSRSSRSVLTRRKAVSLNARSSSVVTSPGPSTAEPTPKSTSPPPCRSNSPPKHTSQQPPPSKPSRPKPLHRQTSNASIRAPRDKEALWRILDDAASRPLHRQTPNAFIRRLPKGHQDVQEQLRQHLEDEESRSWVRPEMWGSGWGRDALAPSSSPGASSSHQRPRPSMVKRPIAKKLVPLSSTVPKRGHPPHHVPWLRQEDGYIKDVENGVPDGTSRVLRDVLPPTAHKPIAQLAHGLDRVLFNPGVHWLQDPRSRVYNFTPWLESIPKVTDFDFDRVTGFVQSSSDTDLWTLAKQNGRIFTGSTSSLTGLLSHIYFLISGDKVVDVSSLTQAFVHQPTNFTPGQRMPTSVIFNYKEGVWSTDSDKVLELAEKNVLTWMGTMLEKFLTVPEREFKKLLRSAPPLEPDTDRRREPYRYAMSDEFVMRSQLDSYDPRLPGTGVFDIKTRAAVPIRLDVLNYEENSGYLIKKLTGQLESFEKEYYDLMRSAFLKYSFQARIGNMDGVLIAYHNTARIFGFQYVSLEEMDQRVYGTGNGARVFDKCVLLLERVLIDVVSIFGQCSIRCTFETRELSNELSIWVEPATWNEQAEGKPRPIKQLSIKVANFIDGVAVSGATAIESDRPWVIRWTLTELALDEVDIRRRLEAARETQFKELNLPAGVSTAEEMEKVWERIDYRGERAGSAGASSSVSTSPSTTTSTSTSASTSTSMSESTLAPTPVSDDDGEVVVTPEEAASAPGSASTTTTTPTPTTPTPTPTSTPIPKSPFVKTLNFRQPDRSILRLRRLAAQGREETLREEAEGREKVVWGAPEWWAWERDSDAEESGNGGTLPGDVDVGGGEVVGGVDGVVVGDAAREG